MLTPKARSHALILSTIAFGLTAGCFGRLQQAMFMEAASPTPTPGRDTPFSRRTLEAFPEASGWQPPTKDVPVAAVAFHNLTADDEKARRGPPALSPDGQFVVYDEGEGANRILIIRRASGETLHRLPLPEGEHPSPRTPAVWSSSSTEIVFAQSKEERHHLFRVGLMGTPVKIAEGVIEGIMAWSPDGSTIALVRDIDPNAIYLMAPNGDHLRRAIRMPGPVQDLNFSPNSLSLVFAAGSEQRDIFVLDDLAQFPKVRQLTRWYFDDIRPSWSATGEQVAFYSDYGASGPHREWSLFVVRSDGHDPASGLALADKVAITGIQVEPVARPAWLPNQELALCPKEAEKGYFTLFAIHPQRGQICRIDPETQINRDVSSSASGVIAFRARHDWSDDIILALLWSNGDQSHAP